MEVKRRINNVAKSREQRRLLRKNSTPEEAMLWSLLKGDKILGVRWRRQFSIDSYILDFYCPKLKLAIELDGNHHYTDSGYYHDSIRERYLSELGIEVLRFENRHIWKSQEAIIEQIERRVKEKLIELEEKS